MFYKSSQVIILLKIMQRMFISYKADLQFHAYHLGHFQISLLPFLRVSTFISFSHFATLWKHLQFRNPHVSPTLSLEHPTSSPSPTFISTFALLASFSRGLILLLLPLRSVESQVSEKNVGQDQAVAYKNSLSFPSSSPCFSNPVLQCYINSIIFFLWGGRWGHHQETFNDGFLCAKVCV